MKLFFKSLWLFIKIKIPYRFIDGFIVRIEPDLWTHYFFCYNLICLSRVFPPWVARLFVHLTGEDELRGLGMAYILGSEHGSGYPRKFLNQMDKLMGDPPFQSGTYKYKI